MENIIVCDVYVKTIERSIKHFKDENNNHWYDYKDLCNEMLIPNREYSNIFYKWIPEYDRIEIDVEGHRSIVKYISAEGFRKLVERNFERGMSIYNDLLNLEFRGREFDNLKSKFNDLENALSNGNVMDIFNNIEMIHSDIEYKEALCKYNPNMDIYVEAVVENIRYEMYEESIDEIILVKEGCEKLTFKKNPKCHKESTCPSWLRNIVK